MVAVINVLLPGSRPAQRHAADQNCSCAPTCLPNRLQIAHHNLHCLRKLHAASSAIYADGEAIAGALLEQRDFLESAGDVDDEESARSVRFCQQCTCLLFILSIHYSQDWTHVLCFGLVCQAHGCHSATTADCKELDARLFILQLMPVVLRDTHPNHNCSAHWSGNKTCIETKGYACRPSWAGSSSQTSTQSCP
jgi:hypothetical protein